MSANAAGDATAPELRAQVMPFLRRLLVTVHAGRAPADQRQMGTHLSPIRAGTGSEFADHRPYQPGDDLRQVNARLWARLGKPMVRQYQQEQARSFLVVLDTSASMSLGVPRKWDQAWPLAAAVVCAGAGSHDRWRLMFANDTATVAAPKPALQVVEEAAARSLTGATRLAATAAAIIEGRFNTNTSVVWISDFLDKAGVEPAIDRLRRAGCTPTLVCAESELESEPFAVTGDSVRLHDIETAESASLVFTHERLQQYKASHRAYYQSLARFCVRTAVPLLRLGPRFETDAQRLLRATGQRP